MTWTFHEACNHVFDSHETTVVFSTVTMRVASMHFPNINVNELLEKSGIGS